MEKGWNAKGRLAPLWASVGGRDKLAALMDIKGQTLSAYNSGKRPLGITNARRIAEALGVSVLDLGAPAEVVEEVDDRRLVDRLQRLEERDAVRETALAEVVVRLGVLEAALVSAGLLSAPASTREHPR